MRHRFSKVESELCQAFEVIEEPVPVDIEELVPVDIEEHLNQFRSRSLVMPTFEQHLQALSR